MDNASWASVIDTLFKIGVTYLIVECEICASWIWS
jgi:hypothetical protein